MKLLSQGGRVWPALLYGGLAGGLTGAIVVVYKFAAGKVIHLSGNIYAAVRQQPLWLLAVVPVLVVLASVFAAAYKRQPNLKGGGIPTAIGVVRDFISFKWFSNLIGTFGLSLGSFLIGVPLGNEGPSVQIGTTIGRGCVRLTGRKGRPWDRYAMTGGACAGFSTATGAPISGLLFTVEEAHQKVTPLLMTVAATAVVCARVVSELLGGLLGVDSSLFPVLQFPHLSLGGLWIPLTVGLAVGLFGVGFLKLYGVLANFYGKTLGKVPMVWKILAIFAVTVGVGLASDAFVSTGHHLLVDMFAVPMGVWMLVAVLVVRSILTLSANTVGITGGLFLPLMALGAIPAALLGWLAVALGADTALAPLILALGVTASIAGIMKTPLTAILFALEALSLGGNVLPVVIAATTAYVATEIAGVQSITDRVLEVRLEQAHYHKRRLVREAYATVAAGAFAEGKTVADILWPGQLTVLSYRVDGEDWQDVAGGHILTAGQRLHLRYTAFGEDDTAGQLTAILGHAPEKIVECNENDKI